MSGFCILRAFGKDFQVDEHLKGSSFESIAVKKEIDFENKEGLLTRVSGFNLEVNKTSKDIIGQIEDSIVFLEQNFEECKKLRNHSSSIFLLDFYIVSRISSKNLLHCDIYPTKLLKLASDIGLDIETSIYPPLVESPSKGGDRLFKLFQHIEQQIKKAISGFPKRPIALGSHGKRHRPPFCVFKILRKLEL